MSADAPAPAPTEAPTVPPTAVPTALPAPQAEKQKTPFSWLTALAAFLAGAAMTALLFYLLILRKRR